MCQAPDNHTSVCIELHNKEINALAERLEESEQKLMAVVEKLKEIERYIQNEESEAMEMHGQAAALRAAADEKRRKASELLTALRPVYLLATGGDSAWLAGPASLILKKRSAGLRFTS